MLMAVPPRVKPLGLYDTTMDGLIVDLFAGGGGASIGIEQAFAAAGIQRHVDIAINHDPDAIACHTRNHPMTDHIQTDVFEVDPVEVTDGKPVRHLHASPDCTDFSRAKGGTPIRLVKRRSLAWVVIRWVFALGPANKPRVITLENVPEFKEWGPLRHREGDHGSWLIDVETGNPLMEPDPDQRGECFEAFVNALRYLGYQVDWRCLSACDYGAPTTRNRLFLIARCDGKPIIWPEVTHGKCDVRRGCGSTQDCGSSKGGVEIQDGENIPANQASQSDNSDDLSKRTNSRVRSAVRKSSGLLPYLTAADIIDWSEPMCSIFATPAEAKAWAKHHDRPCPRRPLAENTLKRIAAGMDRHVLNSANPYIISIANYGNDYGHTRSVDEPLSTVTAYPRGGHHAVVSPVMMHVNHGGADNRSHDMTDPAPTITGSHGMALACPTLIQIGYGERAGQSPRVPGLDKPLGTIVSGGGKHALVAAFLNKHYTGVVGQSVEKPIGTVTSWDHHSLGAAHIVKLKGTCKDGQPVTDPLATVQAGGTHYALVASFMAKYYGCDIHGQPVNEPLHTIPTHERFGLVTVVINGETYAIVDIMMRMLTPRELARAQGFRDDYVIDEGTDGRKLSKRVQVRLIGNSVSPPPMQAIIRANVIPHWPKPAPRCKVRREAVTV
jgi:DNA (cytosine-5)-methyltransferase 1